MPVRHRVERMNQYKNKTVLAAAAAAAIAWPGPSRSQYLRASTARAWPNMALQPTANGLAPLGLYFMVAQIRQAVVCG